jgi:RNA polymerase sigma factor (sigma-70 family)
VTVDLEERATGAPAAARPRRRWVVPLIVLVLLGQMAAAMVTTAVQQTPTIDEPVYVGTAVTYLEQRSLRYNPEHPPLGKQLMAAGLAFASPRLDPAFRGDQTEAVVEADPPQVERPDERVEAQDLAARLRTAVNRLPKLQREAVALAFWGDLPAREIAQHTGVPLGTARSRLRLGIEKLGRAAIDGAQA